MIAIETWFSYSFACALIILSPGPDNILIIARGLSQGRLAAFISSLGAALGLTIHVLLVTFGLGLIIKTSPMLLFGVKIIGASYLIFLGIKALKSRDLINLSKGSVLPLRAVFIQGFLTNVLNPKSALFIMAFIPQFVSEGTVAISSEILLLGLWFVFLAFTLFSLLGYFSAKLSQWLTNKKNLIAGLNTGAGMTFIIAGLSIVLLEHGNF